MTVCDKKNDAKQAFIKEDGLIFLANVCNKCRESKYLLFDVSILILDFQCTRKTIQLSVCKLWRLRFNRCCFYYFLRNSLVALLEALFARD